ncbi:MAG: LysM domain-containing protein [Dehalococcoidia bacterium]|nr:LysM peptidoglycan-binding domain-containing protein [Dehalococcoidia bacterium]MCB9485058.1 LysM peptidoglycan-binding domain-containing protein [Thermoflexaceae bacterium]
MSSTDDSEMNDAVCPHLGLLDDAESHATYATDEHRCYRLDRPTRIAPNHQERYCLSSQFSSCPIFQGEGIGATLAASGGPATPPPAPAAAGASLDRPSSGARLDRPGARPARSPAAERAAGSLSASPRPRPGGLPLPVLTIGLFIGAAVIIGLAFLIQRVVGGDDGGTPAGPGVTQTRTVTGANTAAPTGTQSPGAARTPSGTATVTGTPGTGTPASAAGTYTVQAGDTCSAIASQFNTTFEELRRLNPAIDADCTNLQVDQVIKVP